MTGHGPQPRGWEWSWKGFLEEWRLSRTRTLLWGIWGTAWLGSLEEETKSQVRRGSVGTPEQLYR